MRFPLFLILALMLVSVSVSAELDDKGNAIPEVNPLKPFENWWDSLFSIAPMDVSATSCNNFEGTCNTDGTKNYDCYKDSAGTCRCYRTTSSTCSGASTQPPAGTCSSPSSPTKAQCDTIAAKAQNKQCNSFDAIDCYRKQQSVGCSSLITGGTSAANGQYFCENGISDALKFKCDNGVWKSLGSCQSGIFCRNDRVLLGSESELCGTSTPVFACRASDWSCGSWSACSSNGVQSRTCTLTNTQCSNPNSVKPLTSQSCTPSGGGGTGGGGGDGGGAGGSICTAGKYYCENGTTSGDVYQCTSGAWNQVSSCGVQVFCKADRTESGTNVGLCANTVTPCPEGSKLTELGCVSDTSVVVASIPPIDAETLSDASDSLLANSYCFADDSCLSQKCSELSKLAKVYGNVDDFRDKLKNPFSGGVLGIVYKVSKTLLFGSNDLTLPFTLNDAAFKDYKTLTGNGVSPFNLQNGGVCTTGDVPKNAFEKFAQSFGMSSTTIILIGIGIILFVMFAPRGK